MTDIIHDVQGIGGEWGWLFKVVFPKLFWLKFKEKLHLYHERKFFYFSVNQRYNKV